MAAETECIIRKDNSLFGHGMEYSVLGTFIEKRLKRASEVEKWIEIKDRRNHQFGFVERAPLTVGNK
jgi:hypothetical protein